MRAASLTRLVMAAVACSTLALPASAAAQWGRDRDDRVWDNRVSGEAFNRGLREGEQAGNDDARHGRSFNVEAHREYRDADQGYDRNDGPRDLYRNEFRRGFTEGYQRAFRDDRWDRGDRRDNRGFSGGGPAFRDPGRARGFSDGFNRGVQDRRDNRRFDPERHKEVRQGTAPGYNGSFGSRDRYTYEYRDGFRQGYEDGFRGAYSRR